GLGVDELYRVAEAGVGVVQGLPLPGGQGLVDWFPAGHPRIDRVPHGEMVRAAHQVGPGLRGPAPRRCRGDGASYWAGRADVVRSGHRAPFRLLMISRSRLWAASDRINAGKLRLAVDSLRILTRKRGIVAHG